MSSNPSKCPSNSSSFQGPEAASNERIKYFLSQIDTFPPSFKANSFSHLIKIEAKAKSSPIFEL